jgi:hypothetical protein
MRCFASCQSMGTTPYSEAKWYQLAYQLMNRAVICLLRCGSGSRPIIPQNHELMYHNYHIIHFGPPIKLIPPVPYLQRIDTIVKVTAGDWSSFPSRGVQATSLESDALAMLSAPVNRANAARSDWPARLSFGLQSFSRKADTCQHPRFNMVSKSLLPYYLCICT